MRLLHTMLRVGDLQRSIDFYPRVIGMQLLRTSENTEYRYTLAFVGFGSNPEHAELELSFNWDTTSYDIGTLTATLRWVWPKWWPRATKSGTQAERSPTIRQHVGHPKSVIADLPMTAGG